jgi:hypothetical protein
MEIHKDWLRVQKKLEKGASLKEATKNQPNAVTPFRIIRGGKVIIPRVSRMQRKSIKRSL